METLHWTSQDLELLPEDGKRYEIVDGELYVSKQPHWEHQFVSGKSLHFCKPGVLRRRWEWQIWHQG